MDILSVIYVLAIAAVVAVAAVSLLTRRFREQADRGMAAAFDGVETPRGRELHVRAASVTWLSPEVHAPQRAIVVSLRHHAKFPCVIRMTAADIAGYEAAAYDEWVNGGGDPSSLPMSDRQACGPVLLERLRSIPGLADVRGTIVVRSGSIEAWEAGDQLDPDYAQGLTNVLVALAVEVERPLTQGTHQAAPALP